MGADADGGTGSAYIFYRNQGGTDNWGQQAKLTASDGAAGDWVGSVCISVDYAIVGAHGDDDWTGSAYIFKKPGGAWVDTTETAKLTASDGAVDDTFGASVSISGDYVIVGALQFFSGGPGAAYIFEKPVGGWVDTTETAKLLASDGAANDCFGVSVSISGDYAIVGAYLDDDNGTSSGSAYIFKRDGTSWTELTKLTASDGAAADYFAYGVSLSGDYVIVGAPTDDNDNGTDAGSAYIFKHVCPTADLTGDCFVDFEDFSVFASQWLQGD